MKIITEYDPPPIPDRRFDWTAYEEDTYDYDGPIGRGRTEAEAVADFWIEWEMIHGQFGVGA